jgi:hypothetical protein
MFNIFDKPFDCFVAVDGRFNFAVYDSEYIFAEDYNIICKLFDNSPTLTWNTKLMKIFLKRYHK